MLKKWEDLEIEPTNIKESNTTESQLSRLAESQKRINNQLLSDERPNKRSEFLRALCINIIRNELEEYAKKK